MRGFPYGIRDEATVALSHGVWEGVPDFDAPTQLVNGVHDVYFPKIIVPQGVLFPMCGMNVAVTREAIPYLYFAPPWREMGRCDDIFGGINLKRDFDKLGLAVATGYARVRHDRASNVFSNLHKEGLFIKLNETYWTGDNSHEYFAEYESKLKRWQELLLP
jgi:reversibly glycosylated polypeptide/UDP-arabinopyranose mutase